MAAYKQPIIFCTDALGATLFSTHLDKPGAYIGCMKCGEVFLSREFDKKKLSNNNLFIGRENNVS